METSQLLRPGNRRRRRLARSLSCTRGLQGHPWTAWLFGLGAQEIMLVDMLRRIQTPVTTRTPPRLRISGCAPLLLCPLTHPHRPQVLDVAVGPRSDSSQGRCHQARRAKMRGGRTATSGEGLTATGACAKQKARQRKIRGSLRECLRIGARTNAKSKAMPSKGKPRAPRTKTSTSARSGQAQAALIPPASKQAPTHARLDMEAVAVLVPTDWTVVTEQPLPTDVVETSQTTAATTPSLRSQETRRRPCCAGSVNSSYSGRSLHGCRLPCRLSLTRMRSHATPRYIWACLPHHMYQ